MLKDIRCISDMRDLRFRMMIIYAKLEAGYGLPEISEDIAVLFYIFSDRPFVRVLSVSGFKKFSYGFRNFYQEFLMISRYENMLDFFERLFNYMDGCFAKEV